MKRIWKDIYFSNNGITYDYKGLYQVSNFGDIKSATRQGTKKEILTPHKKRNGYLSVLLCKNGKTKWHSIHRLVAMSFIPNPNNYKDVNHINGIKTDNRVENLEFCTRSRNLKHAWDKGLNTGASKKIIQYTKTKCFIKEWNSISQAGKELKINIGNISECCKKNRKTAGGFVWRIKEEVNENEIKKH